MNQQPFPCPYNARCKRTTFQTRLNLFAHILLSHASDGQHHCPICTTNETLTTTSWDILNAHLIAFHYPAETFSACEKVSRQVHCPYASCADLVLGIWRHLVSHLREEHVRRPFKQYFCPQCWRTVVGLEAIRTHLTSLHPGVLEVRQEFWTLEVVGTAVERVACGECGRDDLTDDFHVLCHTAVRHRVRGERVCQHPDCGRLPAFATEESLLAHIPGLHRAKCGLKGRVEGDICGKVLESWQDFVRHEREKHSVSGLLGHVLSPSPTARKPLRASWNRFAASDRGPARG